MCAFWGVMVEAGNAASMKAGRSWKSDLLSVKYLEDFRDKELHKYRVSLLLLSLISYKQILSLVGIEILIS